MRAAAEARGDMECYLEGLERSQDSSDPEVTLRSRRWSGINSLDFGPESVSPREPSTRTENRLGAVEVAVKGINEKFDCLLSLIPTDTVTPAPRGRNDSGGWAHRQRHDTRTGPRGYRPSQHPHPGMGSPPPRRGGRDDFPAEIPRRETLRGPAYDSYVERQLRREDLYADRVEDGKGIASDVLTKHLEPKPYMYVKRPGLNTIKKKLEVRESLSYNEYVLVYVTMIRDPRANHMNDIKYHLEHLQHLAEDALARDWAHARQWSQDTLDEIEKGTYTWQDQHIIQFERLRSALTCRQASAGHGSQEREERVTPCRDFNGDRGCDKRGHHGAAPYKFFHICAYCYAQTGRHISTHGRAACFRKDVDSGNKQRGFSKNGQ